MAQANGDFRFCDLMNVDNEIQRLRRLFTEACRQRNDIKAAVIQQEIDQLEHHTFEKKAFGETFLFDYATRSMSDGR